MHIPHAVGVTERRIILCHLSIHRGRKMAQTVWSVPMEHVSSVSIDRAYGYDRSGVQNTLHCKLVIVSHNQSWSLGFDADPDLAHEAHRTILYRIMSR